MKSLTLANILASFLVFDQVRGQKDFVQSPDSIRIAFDVHGDCVPALIFVHGWSCDRRLIENPDRFNRLLKAAIDKLIQ